MVIGSGLIARAFGHFRDTEDVLVFASGVSNSRESDPQAFLRESDLARKTMADHPGKLFAYFSTCSIEDPDVRDTPYVRHKLAMEKLVEGRAARYLIFRLPQVVGRSENGATLVNFLHQCIVNGRPFELWEKAVRYIIDIEDVRLIVTHLLSTAQRENRAMTVASYPSPVLNIVRALERITGKSANYKAIDRGTSYRLDVSELQPVLEKLGIAFEADYLEKVLEKYFANSDR